MGREVTYAGTNKKPNGAAGPTDSLPLGKITNENTDKEYEVKECTTEKTIVEEKQLNEKQEEEEEEEETEEVSDDKKFNGYANCTVPQPFEFATEKRGPCTNRHVGPESPVGFASPKSSNLSSPFRNSQPNSPLTPRKQLQPKHKYHADEEDNYSVASSAAASVRTAKSIKAVTVGSAPTFKSGERAEKRREFYMKLEEKQRALEEERSQCEARQREEQEAAIKQMRRNMVVKAKPVPSFYYEGPPPKVELKKLPLTRPKSPKLSRRKSCSDAMRSSSPADSVRKICSRGQRHSIATIKEVSSFSSSPKSKPATSARRSSSVTRQVPKPENEMNAIPCDISVES